MSSWKHSLVVALAAAALFLPGSAVSNAAADGPIVIRYASLAPPGSAFGKILKAWGRQYKKETEGRSELRFYTGGSQGDERDFIRKIRAGQIDAAGITTTGMGMIVRPILVLTAPGLITEMEPSPAEVAGHTSALVSPEAIVADRRAQMAREAAGAEGRSGA